MERTQQTDAQLSTATLLATLGRERLFDLGREYNVDLSLRANKADLVQTLLGSRRLRFRAVLERLFRDELRAACIAHGLAAESRSRPDLMATLLRAHGTVDSIPPEGTLSSEKSRRHLPSKGDVVRARHRTWLVEDVVRHDQLELNKQSTNQAAYAVTLVSLRCLDDDNQGAAESLFWELELGAQILATAESPHIAPSHLDSPEVFSAYLHALKWNAVSATDPELFQSPFRAGIALKAHQLVPLRKALEMPRANLFIADDVGLGKTIEAGLVLQELLLRQRVDFALIVCPPSVSLQWRSEMRLRFGLNFEIVDRDFIARKKRERGFATNPWDTHNRFIVSYQTLRREEYKEPLLVRLGERARKSLLILDEAHTVAPASASAYAIDSRLTRLVRDLAPRFENRLFLSATPHNGHSNSFSSLLEMLDPNRFTRGVKVSPQERDRVMVRRLKADLRELAIGDVPERQVVRLELKKGTSGWLLNSVGEGAFVDTPLPARIYTGSNPPPPNVLADTFDQEEQLFELLDEYKRLVLSGLGVGKKGHGKLVLLSLEKRLLSSVEAFARTLDVHLKSRTYAELAEATEEVVDPNEAGGSLDDSADEDDPSEEASDADDDMMIAQASRHLAFKTEPKGVADVVTQMSQLAAKLRHQPTKKMMALLSWIERNLLLDAKNKKKFGTRKVIIFTEYSDTKRWLRRMLMSAIEAWGLDADDRILELHGGMNEDARAEVQRYFNADPGDHPVRILLATDAAREGVNLQGACADLIHYDVPWNPARLEQRNGRIDRMLQPEPVVRCHYFVVQDRKQDAVLDALVKKVDVIQRELGSLSAVLLGQLGDAMSQGLDEAQSHINADLGSKDKAESELEGARKRGSALRTEIEHVSHLLNKSHQLMQYSPERLREALEVAIAQLHSAQLTSERVARFEQATGNKDAVRDSWMLPQLPPSFAETLDWIRRPRGKEQSFWDWRSQPLPPVTFTAPSTMNDERVHLHLAHPLVQRLLSKLSANKGDAVSGGLSRVSALVSDDVQEARAYLFARLTIFGPGATRLHDEVMSVSAPWAPSQTKRHLLPDNNQDTDAAEFARIESLFAKQRKGLPAKVQAELLQSAPQDFAALWRHMKDEGEDKATRAKQKLQERGRDEAKKLKDILLEQKRGIVNEIESRTQRTLSFDDRVLSAAAEKAQWAADLNYLEGRVKSIDLELESEPAAIEVGFAVELVRLDPVGLVYVWPAIRT